MFGVKLTTTVYIYTSEANLCLTYFNLLDHYSHLCSFHQRATGVQENTEPF